MDYDLKKKARQAIKWKMANNEKISLVDMKTTHINNCLAMLKRKGFVSQSEIETFLYCRSPNGDAALLAYEHEMDKVFNAPMSIFIDIFEAELIYRNGL